MISTLSITPHWLDWYRALHDQRSLSTGDEFEAYSTRALRIYHFDYVNPTPKGSLGDGGCDGVAKGGRLQYACYGSRRERDQENRLVSKLDADFGRAVSLWPSFNEWRFITNVPVGPKATAWLIEQQSQWDGSDGREIAMQIWTPDDLWTRVVSRLGTAGLNELLPGVPLIANIELADIVPLIDSLISGAVPRDQGAAITEVPANKLDYNRLSMARRIEFQSGRHWHPSISRWFARHQQPTLRDDVAGSFKNIYERAAAITDDPDALMERIYVAVGGSDFRVDPRRYNAVYAVTGYFFDACDIFHAPPAGWVTAGTQ